MSIAVFVLIAEFLSPFVTSVRHDSEALQNRQQHIVKPLVASGGSASI